MSSFIGRWRSVGSEAGSCQAQMGTDCEIPLAFRLLSIRLMRLMTDARQLAGDSLGLVLVDDSELSWILFLCFRCSIKDVPSNCCCNHSCLLHHFWRSLTSCIVYILRWQSFNWTEWTWMLKMNHCVTHSTKERNKSRKKQRKKEGLRKSNYNNSNNNSSNKWTKTND